MVVTTTKPALEYLHTRHGSQLQKHGCLLLGLLPQSLAVLTGQGAAVLVHERLLPRPCLARLDVVGWFTVGGQQFGGRDE